MSASGAGVVLESDQDMSARSVALGPETGQCGRYSAQCSCSLFQCQVAGLSQGVQSILVNITSVGRLHQSLASYEISVSRLDLWAWWVV